MTAWPYDVALPRPDGWRPTPFREFVLKVHQRCNLACDYCYVYELADQSWRDRPKLITPALWRAAARRIAEHAAEHELDLVDVVLHGGEPLLAGTDRLLALIADLRTAMPATCEVTVRMQTNGVLLDEQVLTALGPEHVRIGVSVDGTPGDHDRHRRFRDGRGSYAEVERALRLLGSERHRHLYAGMLCTINPATDPLATYESLLAYAPPAVDLLLPHANWTDPTPHGYAEWLIAVFDRWYDAPRRETSIRLLEDIMLLLLGGHGRSEQAGLSPVAVAVVETDGSIEQVDSLKSAYPGACATGRNVLTHSFDDVLGHPGIVARQLGLAALCDTCRSCPLHRVCGAGHYAHRYAPATGFRNPTVYCAEMQELIGHIARRLTADLSKHDQGSC